MEAVTGVGVMREERSHGSYIIPHPRLGDHGEREGRWAVEDRDGGKRCLPGVTGLMDVFMSSRRPVAHTASSQHYKEKWEGAHESSRPK